MIKLTQFKISAIAILLMFTLVATACLKGQYIKIPIPDYSDHFKNAKFFVAVGSDGQAYAVTSQGKPFSRCTPQDACNKLFDDVFGYNNHQTSMRSQSSSPKNRKIALEIEADQNIRWALVNTAEHDSTYPQSSKKINFSIISNAYAGHHNTGCPIASVGNHSSAIVNQIVKSYPACKPLFDAYGIDYK